MFATQERSALDIATELVTQANDAQSALRLRRPDLTAGNFLGDSGGPATSAGRADAGAGGDGEGGEGEAGGSASVAGRGAPTQQSGAVPTLSAALAARPAGGGGGGDDEDDGIPLDLARDSSARRDARNDDASSDDEDVDAEETVRTQLKVCSVWR